MGQSKNRFLNLLTEHSTSNVEEREKKTPHLGTCGDLQFPLCQ